MKNLSYIFNNVQEIYFKFKYILNLGKFKIYFKDSNGVLFIENFLYFDLKVDFLEYKFYNRKDFLVLFFDISLEFRIVFGIE